MQGSWGDGCCGQGVGEAGAGREYLRPTAPPPAISPHGKSRSASRFRSASAAGPVGPVGGASPAAHASTATLTAAQATAAAKRSRGEEPEPVPTLSSPNRSSSTSASLPSPSWHTSAHTLPSAGLVSVRRIRVRTKSQEDVETPAPGVKVCRTACARASGTERRAGASATASDQRRAPVAYSGATASSLVAK